MFYLTTHTTHFIYGYMASDIWLRTILIVREEREREMFYLTTHSTHFIYSYMASDMWLRTIFIVREETHCCHMGYVFRNNSKGSFICTIPHTTAFVTPVEEHWLEREIAQWVHPMKDRSDDPLHHERTLLPWSYISLPVLGSAEGGK